MDKAVIFDGPNSLEKVAEGMGVLQAVIEGSCISCPVRLICENNPYFTFLEDCVCMIHKREFLKGEMKK